MRLRGGLALALASVAIASACGESDSPTSSGELDEARSFTDYTLYYLGESFHGLPLTFAGRGSGTGTGRLRSWSFIYGDCTPSGDDGGCAPPLEVQNWSICTRFPALYPGPTPKTSPAHGAETLPAGGGLDVYTGRTTVVIFGEEEESAAIRSLTRVADDVTPDALPRPVPGSLAGKLSCQRHRLERFSQ